MFLSSKVWSEWPSQGVFTIVYNVRIKFLYWISYWFTKYNIFFLIWHFVFWFCCLLFLLAFASLYFFRYMVLRMLFFEFQYSIYIYIYIYIYKYLVLSFYYGFCIFLLPRVGASSLFFATRTFILFFDLW